MQKLSELDIFKSSKNDLILPYFLSEKVAMVPW